MTSMTEPEKGRAVERVIAARPTSDGAGVRLKRVIGGPELNMFDPFLLLDEFQTDNPDDYIAGFPEHPHRGFETVTYMIHGAMEHKDSVGNRGRLIAGSAQWMTAGRGIIHSEMPKQEQGLMWGFQLWVNLPAARKMIPPRYQDIPPDRIPEVDVAGGRVRVVAGRLAGQEGPVAGIDVEPIFLDVALPEGGAFRAEIPEGHNAFVFVTRGGFAVGSEGRAVGQGFMSLLNQGPFVDLRSTHKDARALVIAGRPLREPVARYGPFVMNTQAEIQKAIDDYRSGRLVQS